MRCTKEREKRERRERERESSTKKEREREGEDEMCKKRETVVLLCTSKGWVVPHQCCLGNSTATSTVAAQRTASHWFSRNFVPGTQEASASWTLPGIAAVPRHRIDGAT
jgi:hypothetical protein